MDTSESESPEAVKIPIHGDTTTSVSPDLNGSSCSQSHKVHACGINGCAARFSRPWKLSAHKALHFGQKSFLCDFEDCDKAYTSNAHLRRHKSTVHRNGDSLRKTFRCHFVGCNQEFTLVQNMKKHFRRTHVAEECSMCGEKFFNRLQLKKHYHEHSFGSSFKCRHCNLTFEKNWAFNRHLRGHRVHVCPIKGCNVTSQNWTLLRKHLTQHPYDYLCYYCKRGYRRRKFLKAHIVRHMNGVNKRKPYELKKFTCDTCGAELLGKGSLKRHKKLHDEPKEEKPKSPKERAPRKDKGIPKRSLAVILSDIVVPIEVEKKLIEYSRYLEVADF